jgi:chitinase
MLTAALSACRRGFVLLAAVPSITILSYVLSGCAGVVSPSGAQTNPTPSPTDLTISNVQASGVTANSVQLVWATNLPSTSSIDYGTTAAYGTSTPVNNSMVTTHQMGLTSLTPGTTYHYRVRSSAGSDSAASNDQMFSTSGGVDTQAPSVMVTSPAAGAKVSGNVNLTATASDNVAVTNVQFRVDGGDVGASLTAAPFSYLLNSTTLSNGAHTISAVAKDGAGNSTTSATVTVTVDNTAKDTTAPTVAMTSPAPNAQVSGTVAVTATASDNVSVASVQFQLDGANVGTADAASPYAFSWDSTKTSNGSHTLRAIATDGAGNSATSASVTVTVNNTTNDKTPPTIAITAPTSGSKLSGTVAVTATASDNVSVASVQFQIDGANVGGADAASPYGFTWDTTKATNASHTIRAIAIDGAGNSTTSAAVTVTVSNTPTDTTAPTVSISSPTNGATVSGVVNVTANATDNVGVATVQFQVDGANAGGLDGATPYAYSWDTTKLANGTHRLDAIAKDAAGNTTTSALLTVTVNNAAQAFSISGTLSPTSGGSGATVTLSGTSGATTTANASGAYTFTGLAKGIYTVTPSHTGFTFSPGSQSATITTANVTGVNFTATATPAPTFTISGTISPTSGGSGATVTLSGTSGATTTANGSGAYTFTGLAKGNYAVTPSHTGFTFSPTSQSASITTANVTGLNFTATATAPQTFTISGTISGGAGATVLLGGAAGATTTANSSGNFTFTGLANGNYTVTPSDSGFTFTPANQSVTVSGANKTGVNFTAAADKPHAVNLSWSASTSSVSGYNVYRSTTSGSGYTKLNSSLVTGTTYTDSNVQSGTTYFYVTTSVDSGGDESAHSNQASATIP